MAYVSKLKEDGKSMADDDLPEKPEADPPDRDGDDADSGSPVPYKSASTPASRSGGFFTIYKKGQGYWTRMGTAIGIALIALFTGYNLYVYVPTFLPTPKAPATLTAAQSGKFYEGIESRNRQIGIAVGVLVALAIAGLGYWASNKPSNVDFLIATDSEMKKVNWTSRKDLIASTRIVIIFMFSVAIFLFVVDIIFGYLFNLITVLKSSPFGS